MRCLTFIVSALAACLAHRCCFAQTVGDVRLQSGGICNDATASGVLEVFLDDVGWSTVSGGDFGHLEAQVVCVQLGHVFMDNIAQAELLRNDTLYTYVRSMQCNGSEQSVSECEIQQATQVIPGLVAYVTCNTARTTAEGVFLIVFDNPLSVDPAATLSDMSVIAPAHNLYLEMCQSSKCSGSHIFNDSAPIFQFVLSFYGQQMIPCSFITTGELMINCTTSPSTITADANQSCSSGAMKMTSSAAVALLVLVLATGFVKL